MRPLRPAAERRRSLTLDEQGRPTLRWWLGALPVAAVVVGLSVLVVLLCAGM
jgi:hypothetical protein